MPWVFNYEDKQLIGYQACEGATVTEFRNKSLFTKMFLFSEQLAKEMNIYFYFGFPSKMSYGPVYRAGYYPIINFKFVKRYLIPGVKKFFDRLQNPSIFQMMIFFFMMTINYNLYSTNIITNGDF